MELNFAKWMESLALKGNYKGTIFQRLVAAKYMLSPMVDPSALPAFEDLKRKISRQGQFLRSKFQFQPTENDPYHSMKAMTKDIENQKELGLKKPIVPVYNVPPKQNHPAFTNDDNVEQRGVHDVIAHYYGQHPFSARGEYSAYNRHLKTLCNTFQVKSGNCLAAKAMFTEVVAQTSCFYVYGDYVEQKAVILTDFDHAHVGSLNPSSELNKYFVIVDKNLVVSSDFDWKIFENEQSDLAKELLKQPVGKQRLQPIAPQEFS